MLPVGRKELFGFVERHSGRKMKEYSDLSDGNVLAALFNKVFLKCRIPVVTKETHSATQMAHHNWSSLANRFRKLGIPLDLIDRKGIEDNDPTKGFAAIVLFYFMYNVTRQKDFTAEFTMDVPQELTTFLQSVESVRALVLGGALSIQDVPEQLRAQITLGPATQLGGTAASPPAAPTQPPPASEEGDEYSSIDQDPMDRSEEREDDLEQQYDEDDDDGGNVHEGQEDEEDEEGYFPESTLAAAHSDTPRAPVPHAQSPSVNIGEKARRTFDVDDASMEKMLFVDALRAELQALKEERDSDRRVLAEKEVEIRQLQQNAVSLLEQTSRLRSERRQWKCGGNKEEEAEDASSSGKERLQELEQELASARQQIEAMQHISHLHPAVECGTSPFAFEPSPVHQPSLARSTSDPVDAATSLPTTVVKRHRSRSSSRARDKVSPAQVDVTGGIDEDQDDEVVVDVHEEVHALHSLLLEHVPRKLREGLQQKLWDVLSSYHVLESRIVSASASIQRLLEDRAGLLADNHKLEQAVRDSTQTKKANEREDSMRTVAALRLQLAEREEEVDLLRSYVSSLQKQHEEALLEIHRRTSTEMAPVLEHVEQLQERAIRSAEREATWKALCQALRRSEEISRILLSSSTSSDDKAAMDAARRAELLKERGDCEAASLHYVQVLSTSSSSQSPLVSATSLSVSTSADLSGEMHSPLRGVSRAMEHLVGATAKMRDDLQKQLAAAQRMLSAERLRVADVEGELAAAKARAESLERMRTADKRIVDDLRAQVEASHKERLALDAKLQHAYEANMIWGISAPASSSSSAESEAAVAHSISRPSATSHHQQQVESHGTRGRSPPNASSVPPFRLSFPSPATSSFHSPPTEQKFVAHRATSASPLGPSFKARDDLLAQGFFASPASSPPPRTTAA